MSLTQGTRRALLRYRGRQGATYASKVLGYGPLAYWIQGEAAGLTSIEQVNSPAQDGTYTGVTLGQTGIGDGNTCPLYDGINDLDNVHSATLAGVFDGTLGTLVIWARVFNAGVWTDAAFRAVINIGADANNRITLLKFNIANRLDYYYIAGGVTENVTLSPISPTGWMFLAVSWSGPLINDRFRAYYADAATPCYQVGATPGLGVWAGALANGECSIGARSAGTNHWSGYEAHTMLFDQELTLADLTDLSVV